MVKLINGYFPREDTSYGSDVSWNHYQEEHQYAPLEYENLDGEGEPQFSDDIDGWCGESSEAKKKCKPVKRLLKRVGKVIGILLYFLYFIIL